MRLATISDFDELVRIVESGEASPDTLTTIVYTVRSRLKDADQAEAEMYRLKKQIKDIHVAENRTAWNTRLQLIWDWTESLEVLEAAASVELGRRIIALAQEEVPSA